MLSLAYFFFCLLLALSSQKRTCDPSKAMYILNRGTGYFLGHENSEDSSFLPPKNSISPNPPDSDAILNYLYEKWCFSDDDFYQFSWPYRNDSPSTKIILDEEINCPSFKRKILKVVGGEVVVGKEDSNCAPPPLEELWELNYNQNTFFFGIKSKAYMYKKWLATNSLFVLQDNGVGFKTKNENDILQQWIIQA